ncbi:hypothetical protein FA13DRAFT_995523 [Coprinellus micaceus]|uniref:Uncharacterized protein n=1 Tax=Coprinellus micaceus TaxID=71717 RepID=A0A4Y7SYP0_COPMI|nr:hypothetical protein FA13DRAFT_995523 [Coprinellus micaceus]
MSVTSLPAYNKEPGEQELVIFRGTDMEDVEIPLAHVAQDDESESRHTRDRSQGSSTSHSLQNEPLLEEPEPPQQQTLSSQSRRDSRRESSHHNIPHSTEESQRLMHHATESVGNVSAAASDDRGEAPPYFEVVDPAHQVQPAVATPNDADNDTSNNSASQSPPTTAGTDSSNLSPPSSPDRRSGIRTFFNRMQTVGAPRGLGHARGPSDGSSMSHASGPSSSTSRHRQTPSTTSSFFRTLSRQRSQSPNQSSSSIRLNSPSLISLNSISSPLTHTLTRTEITYPKSGPTPEQLKMISSRESIARFGVPYGPDALAFASTSMLDLTSPPPDFDSIVGVSNAAASTTSLNAVGGNAAAGTSRVSLHVRGDSNGLARIPSPLAAIPPAVRQETLEASPSGPGTPTVATSPTVADTIRGARFSAAVSIAPEDIPLPYPDETIMSRATTYRSMKSHHGVSDEFGVRLPRTSTPTETAFSNASGRVSEASMRSGMDTVNSQMSYATANESISTRRTRRSVAYPSTEDEEPEEEEVDGVGKTDHRQETTDATIVSPVASGLAN